MKALDYIITRDEYNNSSVNKGGTFVPPLGILRNFSVADTQNPTDAELDKIFKIYWQASFDDINAFNSDRPLNFVDYIDLQNAKADAVIKEATILQVNELLQNGLVEIKNSNQSSTGAFTSTISPNTRIVSSDQISQDVEDKLQEIDYREWRVQVEDGEVTVFLNGERLLIAKTANLVALSSLLFKSLDPQDNVFLGEKYIIKLIQSTASNSRTFRGTYAAPSEVEAANINTVFGSIGLTLTDGTKLDINNVHAGDTILITVNGSDTYMPEESIYDGNKWVTITNNNSEKMDIVDIKARIKLVEDKLSVVEQNLTTLTQTVNQNKQDQTAKNTQTNDAITALTTKQAEHKQAIDSNTQGVNEFNQKKNTFLTDADIQMDDAALVALQGKVIEV